MITVQTLEFNWIKHLLVVHCKEWLNCGRGVSESQMVGNSKFLQEPLLDWQSCAFNSDRVFLLSLTLLLVFFCGILTLFARCFTRCGSALSTHWKWQRNKKQTKKISTNKIMRLIFSTHLSWTPQHKERVRYLPKVDGRIWHVFNKFHCHLQESIEFVSVHSGFAPGIVFASFCRSSIILDITFCIFKLSFWFPSVFKNGDCVTMTTNCTVFPLQSTQILGKRTRSASVKKKLRFDRFTTRHLDSWLNLCTLQKKQKNVSSQSPKVKLVVFLVWLFKTTPLIEFRMNQLTRLPTVLAIPHNMSSDQVIPAEPQL